MKNKKDGYNYNERLFSGGLRSKLHYARFHWFSHQINKYNCVIDSILELGCFDGKLIDFLPRKPLRYVGFDANWEGGLDIARAKWVDAPNLSFIQVSSPEEMHLTSSDIFNLAVSMETLEHIPPKMVDDYLRKIAQHLRGYFFITVPNEKGIVFLGKWISKKILSNDDQNYTLSELINATLGRMDLVARREHKGFDYMTLIENIKKYFDIIDISGHPNLGFFPPSLCFGIGIIAKSKTEI